MATHTAISDAIKEAVSRIIGRTPLGATGVYFSGRYGITFGFQHRDNRAIPDDYIWFEDQPKKLQRYDENIYVARGDAIAQTPAESNQTIIIEMNPRQANVLYRLSGNVGGDPSGARVVFNKLREALHAAGVDGMSDHSLRFDSTAHITSDADPAV